MIYYLFYVLLDSVCNDFVKNICNYIHEGVYSYNICLISISGQCYSQLFGKRSLFIYYYHFFKKVCVGIVLFLP